MIAQSPPQTAQSDADEKFEVRLTHAFGSCCGLKDFCGAALFGDVAGDHVVHPVGRRISLQHLASGETSFVPFDNTKVEAVTACAISQDRSFLAVCERCTSDPLTHVSVYDLSKPGTKPVRVLEELANSVGRLISIAFSSDVEARRLILASAPPEGLLVLIDWRDNVVLGRCTLEDHALGSASHVALNPMDEGMVSSSGDNYVQLWRVTKNRLMPLPALDGIAASSEIADHTWIRPYDGNIAACCSTQGCVYILSTAPLAEDPAKLTGIIHVIEVPFPSALAEARHAPEMPLRVLPVDSGLLLGGSRGALSLWLFDKNAPPASRESSSSQRRRSHGKVHHQEMEYKPRHIHTSRTRLSDTAVSCLDVVPEDDGSFRILVGFHDAAIGVMSMHLEAVSREHEVCIILAGGYHNGPITSLDVARKRPIFATACKKDGTVRVWSYATRHCEVCWECPHEELTSVAVHPNGYCIAAGTTSKIRFFQVLIGQLKQYREVSIRAVRSMKFSNDGHHLAASQGRAVVVFSSQSMERLATLRGHGQIISVSWQEEDRVLVTHSDEGQMARWDTTTWEKLQECQAGGLEVYAVSVEDTRQSFASVLDTRSMRMFISPFDGLERSGEGLEIAGDVRLAALCFAAGPRHSALFTGLSTGSLRLHSAPLTSLRQHEDFHLHAGGVAAMCLSSDSRTLVSAGVDGSIFLLDIVGLARSDAPIITQDDDFVMISQSEVQRIDEELEVLNSENANLKELRAEAAARLESESRGLIAEARQKDHEVITQLHHEYEVLQQAVTTKERECMRQMKAMETQHLQAADKIEQHYDRKVAQEADRFMALEAEVSQLEDKVKAMRAESQRQLDMLKQRHRQELRQRGAEKEAEVQRHKELLAFSQLRFDTMLDQEAMEHGLEVNEQKRTAQKELEQQMQIEYKLKKEQDTLLRGLDLMEKDRDRIQKEQMASRATIHSLEMQKESLTQTVKALKDERRDREVTLREKELQIGAHKVKVNTLKKFKHVLDFRLREVTLSLQPKDHMIKELNSQLHGLEEEFEKQLEQQSLLEDVLEKKNQEEQKFAAERVHLQDVVKQREHTIEHFREALYNMVNHEVDARKWPPLFKKIHDEHLHQGALAHDKEMELPMKETRRQMKVMEGKVNALMAKNKRTDMEHSNRVRQQTEENSEIIRDMSKLRAENKVVEAQVKELELQVQQAECRRAQQLKALEDGANPSNAALQDGDDRQEQAEQPLVMLKAASGDEALRPSHRGMRGFPRQPASSSAGRASAARALEHARRMKAVREAADANSAELHLQAQQNKALREEVERLAKAKEQEKLEQQRLKQQQEAEAAAKRAAPQRKVRVLLAATPGASTEQSLSGVTASSVPPAAPPAEAAAEESPAPAADSSGVSQEPAAEA